MRLHQRAGRASLAVLVCTATMAGCALKQRPLDPIAPEVYPSGSAYVYQPLNPTTIWVRDPEKCELTDGDTKADYTSPEFKRALLRDLDTETVRVSLNEVNADASASGTVVGAAAKHHSYVLIVDYIKYFTMSKPLTVDYHDSVNVTAVKTLHSNIPLYAGVGVRIRAEFVALEGNLNVSGLPGLALAAEAKKVNGRITVQTLGITGPDITALMPIISDLSIASIQSAVQAVAAIKAKLYEDSTVAYPKIVGFESPTANVEAITSLTRQLYGLNESVTPRVSPNPVKDRPPVLWIEWLPNDCVRDTTKATSTR